MANQSITSLTWCQNPHGKTEMLMNLFNSNKLTDATLVCDDGKWFGVHRAVISIYSPLLRKILIETEQTDPIIIITNVLSTDIKVILELMYTGEAQMNEGEEMSFHQTLKFLEIKNASLDKTFKPEDNYLIDKDPLASSKPPYDSNIKTKSETVQVKDTKKLQYLPDKSKIHACEQCNYKSATLGSLKIHIEQVHINKKYKCSQCIKEYRQSSGLREHIKTAHEGKRFKCDQCSYESISRCNLKTHKLSKHEGVRFKCSLCSDYLSSKDRLADHTQKVHLVGKYSCNFCSKEFRLDSMLTNHMKSHGVLKNLKFEN